MPGVIRQTWLIVGVASTLLVVTGYDRGGEMSAAANGVASTSAATPGAPRDTMDLDQADDRIEAALRADSALAAFRLDADDERGRIVLEGVVATQAQKDRAAEIAASAAPDIPIDNQVRVDAAARTRAADDAAEDRVEDAFDADTTLRVFNLDADDEHGRLVLKGTVRTAAQRDRAEDIAKRLAPGIRIENRIRVE